MEPTEGQVVEINAKKFSDKSRKRLKARHLSALVRKAILDKFSAVEDLQETADQLDIDGLTKDTVASVLHSFAIRKQTAQSQTSSGREPYLMVRKAGGMA